MCRAVVRSLLLTVMFFGLICRGYCAHPLRLELCAAYPASGISLEYLLNKMPIPGSVGLSPMAGYFPFTVPFTGETSDNTLDPYSLPVKSRIYDVFVGGFRLNYYPSQDGRGVYFSPGWNYLTLNRTVERQQFAGDRAKTISENERLAIHIYSVRAGYRVIWNHLTFSIDAGYGLWITDRDKVAVNWELEGSKVEDRHEYTKRIGGDIVAGIGAGLVF